ncbi:hypothetical protein ACFU5O_20800 [Streptomyces sp. NPDC057445]|uniref:AMIN-like domain-containing (lipo)protein n=1 Tax=Streptomyces sp. NPDC057445 TaxID=3346136 RepID=UPI00369BC120
MRKLGMAAGALVVAGAGLVGTTGSADGATGHMGRAASAKGCATSWGSGTKSAVESATMRLKVIVTSQSRCYDRMIFHVKGVHSNISYHVGYVTTFQQDGSGERIPVRGGGILQIFVSAPSYDPETGSPTYAGKAGKPLPGVTVAGYRTFKDAKFGASFEGRTQIGLGVRAKLPFRAVQSGDKLIVDVAHTW